MRGNPSARSLHQHSAGSIPARAGEPPNQRRTGRHHGVYPRACGGTCAIRSEQCNFHDRSIPARAGEPATMPADNTGVEVYPRACGGTCPLDGGAAITSGSIPARAGGTTWARSTGRASRGLSPRVRGNRPPKPLNAPCAGSIPARAGEPVPHYAAATFRMRPVYPRACGGTSTCISTVPSGGLSGLSPRVRGNPASCPPQNTTGWVRIETRRGLSPRVRGNPDQPGVCNHHSDTGLSPRVRGNHLYQRSNSDAIMGSIPARAGEPCAIVRTTTTFTLTVYPRACGGTGYYAR